jgi:Ca2+-binding RTX toxin-like protein
MATKLLTTAADIYIIDNGLVGSLQGGTVTSAKGDSIDGGTGTAIDTINILDNYLGNFYLTADINGVVTITTSSGINTFSNFEKITFKGAGAINLATAGNDTITGTAKNDLFLSGGAGNDTIDGGLGIDFMQGGSGNDIYYVDDIADKISELAGNGTDEIRSSVNYSLADTDGSTAQTVGKNAYILTYNTAANGGNVENLTLTGTLAINGTGNGLDNVIVGNSAANVITGGGGNDTIDGGAGTDTFVLSGAQSDYTFTAIAGTNQTRIVDNRPGSPDGTDVISNIENIQFGTAAAVALSTLLVAPITGTTGNDTIIGTTGADTMVGQAGDDTYTVNDAGDVVTELLNEGIDTVNASINYTLAANVEKLNLTGTAISGTGNTLDNTITGNASANIIDGGTGADAMTGGAGNDTYYVDNALDTVTEVAGGGTADTVISSISLTLAAEVENLTLATGTAALDGTGNALANTITGNDGNNVLDGGADALVDTLIGGLGNDTYVLGAGNDTVSDTGGTDTITSTITRSLANYAAIENLTLLGGTVAIDGTGNALVNIITGNDGNNVLDGGADALVDTLIGGLGNDTYVLGAGNDTVSDTGGNDTITSTITRSLVGYGQIENLTLLGSTVAIDGTGNALANTITGNDGNNVLDGGVDSVVDTLIGGLGNDTYVLGAGNDSVSDTGGVDTITSTITRSLVGYGQIENLTLLGGTAAIDATGNDLANTITGNDGNNVIDGGAGADAMTGGAGDDTFIVDNIGDTAIEAAGGGIDTVKASVDFTLGAEVEKLIMLTGAVSGTGNALDNVITGNAASNAIDGGAGSNDVFVLTGARSDYTYTVIDATHTQIVDNRVGGGDGTDTITNVEFVQFASGAQFTIAQLLTNLISGTDAIDSLTGTTGSDMIDGGLSADTMTGLGGNDCYIIDNAGDTVVEVAGEGTDEVQASVSYTLSSEVENLMLMTGAVTGTGNTAINTITGNDAANTLNGMGGTDTLIGGNGNDTYVIGNAGVTVTETATGGTADTVNASMDYILGANIEVLNLMGAALKGTGNGLANTLNGNAGANTLNGLVGADKMAGGGGNDIYVVDNAGDVVDELVAGSAGIDLVQSSVTFSLADAVHAKGSIENLTLAAGVTALNGTGNALVNTIIGNSGANILNGMGGADKMTGGAGNDTYYVDSALDVVTELAGGGTLDHVKASVSYVLAAAANIEFLETANALLATAVNLTGNALGNTITGNKGANIITGGLGHDDMTGGLGRDVFDFNLITETTKVATTRDFITDFTHLTDRIDLSTIDANTKVAGNQAFSFLAAKGAAFTGVAGQLHYIAQGANTIVEGDIDGNKVADFQIQLNGVKPLLTVADFVL